MIPDTPANNNPENNNDGQAFNAKRIEQQFRQGDQAILNRLEAVELTRNASSPREAARAHIKVNAISIRKLIDAGVSQKMVLSDLITAMPDIPEMDLKVALKSLWDKHVREKQKVTNIEPIKLHQKPITTSKKLPIEKSTVLGVQTPNTSRPKWADGSDKFPNESEEEYALRKTIEGDPKKRSGFIGED